MGCGVSTAENTRLGLQDAVLRAQSRTRLSVTGRYHRPPRRLEDDYAVEEQHVLGRGYNGTVLRATSKRTGQAFAVKAFSLKCASRQKAYRLRAEAEIYLAMDHPHVARLVDVYEGSSKLHLVMECMSGGELFGRVTKLQRFSEAGTARAVSQMLLAVTYLHSHGVVHRDLKLQNFLYESEDSDHLKLIDFGFSEFVAPNTTMKAFVGTLTYMAPEVLHVRARYTSQCDLWSLGVVAFALLVGYMPFYGSEAEQMRMIRAGQWKVTQPGHRLDTWANLSKAAKDFVARLLTVNPQVRLTAPAALHHPFIADCLARERSTSKVDLAIVEALSNFAKVPRFRKACMEVMAWSLTSEEQAQVRDAFEQMDESCQGTITLAELRKALVGRGQVTDDLIVPIFKALDTERTQEIHYSEFLAAMVSTRIALHDDLLSSTFRRFDTDNSGYITLDNLREVLGDSFDGAPAEELLREADLRCDRQISYDAFAEYLQQQPGAAQPPRRSTSSKLSGQKVKQCRSMWEAAADDAPPGPLRAAAAGGGGGQVPAAAAPPRSCPTPPPSPGWRPVKMRGLAGDDWWWGLAQILGPCGCGPVALAACLSHQQHASPDAWPRKDTGCTSQG